MKTWGIFEYQDTEGRYPCNRQLGWCADCNDLVPMEDFSNPDSYAEHIEDRLHWLKSETYSAWQAFLNALSRRRRTRHQEWLVEAEAALRGLRNGQLRRGTERCLKCGSQAVSSFDGCVDVRLSDDGMVFEGRNPTGYLHPGCGGEFVAEGSEMRFSMRFFTRVYSPEGYLLAEE